MNEKISLIWFRFYWWYTQRIWSICLKITAIHQFTPVLAKNDAIGRTLLEMQKLFREWGYTSEIYVETPIDETSKISYKYTDYQPKKSDLVIYHHSIGSVLADFVSKLRISKILCYHNITPPHFFTNYNKDIASQLHTGRLELEKLAGSFEYVMAASDYTKQELRTLGFQNILPFQYFINMERFNKIKPKHELLQKFSDTKNIIFVGRKVPNKKIDDLLKVFAYFKILNPKSRLFVLGGSWSIDAYVEELNQLIQILKLEDVIFVNTLTDEELASYYKVSNAFLCMSEHEGFCIPLVEAMYFDLPIVAFNSSAIPDTLGGSGILVNHKKYAEIAEILDMITSNQSFQNEILSKQKERLKSFSIEAAKRILKENIDKIIANLSIKD